MESIIHSPRFIRNADSLIASAIGFCIILILTHHGGIGISPDSITYMSVAENIHEHGVLQDFNQTPLTDFPAFYPVFLACVSWLTGLKPLVFGPVLNGLLFAAVIYISGLIMEHFYFRSRWYKWAILSCIVFSPPLWEIYSMLWSETLFILLLLLFIIAIYRYLWSHSVTALLVASLLASLACVTRYAGISFIATGGLLLLADRQLSIRKKTIHMLLSAVFSVSLPVINLLYNNHVAGTLTGPREKAINSFGDNLHDTGVVFCEWLPFLRGQYAVASATAFILIAGLAVSWLLHYFRKNKPASYENIAVSFCLTYSLFMIVSATVSRYETLNNRLISPIFIPLLWGMGNWLTTMIEKTSALNKKVVIILCVLFFACFQYNQFKTGRDMWEGVKDAGIPGYTEDQWRHSQTVQFMENNRQLIKGFTVYSNANDAVYFFTGLRAELLPHKEAPQDIQEFVSDNFSMVIWFNDGNNPELVDQPFINDVKKMVLFRQFDDGAIYISRK